MLFPSDLEDQAQFQEKLDWTFRWRSTTQRQLDQYYHDLEDAIALMIHAGLKEHNGRTLGSLKAQLEYRGRTFFTRRLLVELSDGQGSYGQPAGLNQRWEFPRDLKRPTFKFELISENSRRRLAATVRTKSEKEDPNYLTDSELRVHFQPMDPFYASISTHIQLERRGCKSNDWKSVNHSHTSNWEQAIDQAFRDGGIDGTWKQLDKIWLDISSTRPLIKPLKPLSIEIRYWLHNGQPVKVFTRQGSFAGIWQHTVRNSANEIIMIRIELAKTPGSSVDISANEILELLPCRLECEA